ncbi:flightin isoform X1 [Anthonomus grandis grandis]|uniref:flightin isoform X1 n=1 Tax=Anthonomus grandis grandis TaxID=2921223 RepID=UPI0021659BC7|nr:flightin isoform X1 [Anthonomus grandis grandis]XP_050301294.1 flightin isoform X1 [Anthonomus grandis grandis]
MDDEPDWFGGAEEEPAPAPAPLKGKKKKSDKKDDAGKKEEEAPPAATPEAAPAEGAPAEEAAEAADEYLDPDKLLLFKHWIRPKYLQYKCLYDYRRSYYDDVMEVINSRRKGFKRDIPRPQTWAERVLRTGSDPIYKLESFDQFLEDIKLVTRTEVSGRIYKSQSMSNFNRRYTTKIDF